MAPFGSDAANFSPASTELAEFTTTCAPSSAKRCAVRSPIPLDEPVTIATIPENSDM